MKRCCLRDALHGRRFYRSHRSVHQASLKSNEFIRVILSAAAAGIKYIGGVDWYASGVKWLLRRQQADGSWDGDLLASNRAMTALCVLFLARGRAPVAFNKLQFPAPGQAAGNQRPRDIASLTRWLERQLEHHRVWQQVPATAPLGDVLEAPVLYIAGSTVPNLDAETKAKLRMYVDAGGLILGSADCAAPEFVAGFKRLAAEMFPQYPLRELPEDHPIYNGVYPRPSALDEGRPQAGRRVPRAGRRSTCGGACSIDRVRGGRPPASPLQPRGPLDRIGGTSGGGRERIAAANGDRHCPVSAAGDRRQPVAGSRRRGDRAIMASCPQI